MENAIDHRETLYVTDAELIRRWGVPEKRTRRLIMELDVDRDSGFPPKQPLFGYRRYWPAIQEWMRGVPLPPADEDHNEKLGKVYFLASQTHVKIGFSVKSRKRLKTIRAYHYEELELIGLILKVPQQFETALHRKFKAHRVPRREWFRRVPEIEEFATAHHLKPWRGEMP